MNWFLVAILGYTLLAIVFILDKFIVSNSAKPAVYAFYSSIVMVVALLALPFTGWGFLQGLDWCWAIVSGVAFGLGLWTLFVAVKKGEASHINPFNGAIITILIYFLANLFLGEQLTSLQVGGMIILFFASILLSFEKTRVHSGFHMGFVWAIVSGLFFAISHVSAKYLYGVYPFWTALAWSKATAGLVGLGLLLLPSVRAIFKQKNKKQQMNTNKRSALIIIFNKIFSVVANLLIQYAMAIGSVTLVGAMSGLQYIFMFVFIYLLTKFLPKLFKEYFTKREIAVEIIAIILVAIGSIFFVL